jgi:hypothetical protein
MTVMTKRTAKMLVAKAELIGSKLPEEAQKLLDTYCDPNVPQDQKDNALQAVDSLIKKYEERIETKTSVR